MSGKRLNDGNKVALALVDRHPRIAAGLEAFIRLPPVLVALAIVLGAATHPEIPRSAASSIMSYVPK